MPNQKFKSLIEFSTKKKCQLSNISELNFLIAYVWIRNFFQADKKIALLSKLTFFQDEEVDNKILSFRYF